MITITQADYRRLARLLASEFAAAIGPQDYLDDLHAELQRASVVPEDDVQEDTVTMNSRVELHDLDTGEVETYTLVFPHRANIAENRLSVLAPIGTAILGYSVGDVVQWRVPGGVRRLRIGEVTHQPEREGAVRL